MNNGKIASFVTRHNYCIQKGHNGPSMSDGFSVKPTFTENIIYHPLFASPSYSKIYDMTIFFSWKYHLQGPRGSSIRVKSAIFRLHKMGEKSAHKDPVSINYKTYTHVLTFGNYQISYRLPVAKLRTEIVLLRNCLLCEWISEWIVSTGNRSLNSIIEFSTNALKFIRLLHILYFFRSKWLCSKSHYHAPLTFVVSFFPL